MHCTDGMSRMRPLYDIGDGTQLKELLERLRLEWRFQYQLPDPKGTTACPLKN